MIYRKESYRYIEFPEIGTILFRKSDRAKRVIISIKSPSKVVVSVPRFISFKRAKSFVRLKLDWIIKKINELQIKKNAFDEIDTISNEQKQQLINRVEFLSKIYNLDYKKVTLRKMKTRWGSCSQDNNISLNIGLANIPRELSDYVILHELVHTKIKNHSKIFWKELIQLIPDARKFNRELNKNYKLYDI